jgi:lysine 2,3-aminomutase
MLPIPRALCSFGRGKGAVEDGDWNLLMSKGARRNGGTGWARLDADSNWMALLGQSVTGADRLAELLPVEPEEIRDVISHYPMRINPYYLSLMAEPGDPIWLQAVPDPRELQDPQDLEDPLGEEALSPVPNIIHRYPDRVLFMVSHECAVYCRFCNRKRKIGRPFPVSSETLKLGLEYIRGHGEVRDVLLSGGDPLLLSDAELDEILGALRSIPHVEIIRIGSRAPCTLPHRITPRLCAVLRRHHPLYISTHFNHPRELTQQAKRACAALANAGIPLGNQAVLLKGVNDLPEVMISLMRGLAAMRIRPYYLFHADPVRGTGHFRTSVRRGLEIMESVLASCPGVCVPHYVLDLPQGGGKVPLLPHGLRKGETACAPPSDLV